MNVFVKDEQYIETEEGLIYTTLSSPKNPRGDKLTVLLLHGAGQSNSEKYTDLAYLFINRGMHVLALDFIGHGKTGGEVFNNSLALRNRHAVLSVERRLDSTVPLIVIGSSMGGHTALRVSSIFGDRVKSLGLLQPAIYASEAEDVYFGPDFTKILRRPNSWNSSFALRDASSFTGRSIITIGTEDQVIPWGVIEKLQENLKQHSSQTKLQVIEGVGHELPTWLPHHPDQAAIFVNYLVDSL